MRKVHGENDIVLGLPNIEFLSNKRENESDPS